MHLERHQVFGKSADLLRQFPFIGVFQLVLEIQELPIEVVDDGVFWVLRRHEGAVLGVFPKISDVSDVWRIAYLFLQDD